MTNVPRNAAEMITMLVSTAMSRAYVDLSTAARRGRLTEHDIALVERGVLDNFATPEGIGEEFKTFEAEPAFAKARELIKEFFAATRAARTQHIQQK